MVGRLFILNRIKIIWILEGSNPLSNFNLEYVYIITSEALNLKQYNSVSLFKKLAFKFIFLPGELGWSISFHQTVPKIKNNLKLYYLIYIKKTECLSVC